MTTTPHIPRLDFDRRAARVAKAMNALDAATTATATANELEPSLRELARIRASQLNGCAYCIDMHTKDARAAGESEQRIYALPAWRETPYFTDRERAALAFTEAVTVLTDGHLPDEVYEVAAKHFDETELAALLSVVVTINAWNRISVVARSWEVGSYQP
ncbi:MAG TPA: carboxymuconolactone decarboxylase family protein [Jiangellaceae bacterium]|nr:carboxymuconolactone decarboxylase family protein [Jiangellaceae bacterium]